MPTFRMRDGSGSIRLKHVIEDTDRHGNVRVYLRRPGHLKVRLRSQPGTEDFLAEYRAALMGAIPRAPTGPLGRRGSKGSFKWLCEQYYVSAEYQRLGDRTKYVRRGILDRICEKNGSKPYALMEPRHVRRMRDEMADRPEAANGFVKALRQVYAFAVEYELAQRNPARDVPYLKAKGDGFHSWTMEEVRQFEEHYPIGSKPRLALSLMLYTGQRRSDIVRLGPQHIKEGWITLTQAKNRDRKPVTLSIPVLPELKAVLYATPTGNLAFLVTAFDKPFTSNGFGNWFRKQCDEAGLKHCSAHGLRKAGAALAAENGATERQLMAIFGWTTMKEASRYTRAARQKVLAASGMKLLSRDGARRKEGKCEVANRDTSSSRAKTEMTKKKLEAGMTKTEQLKPDESASSTLPPEEFAKFEATMNAPANGFPASLERRKRRNSCSGMQTDPCLGHASVTPSSCGPFLQN